MKFNLILLAAGQSIRMQYPKALLKFNERYNFLEQIIAEYTKHPNLNKIFIVSNSEVLEKIAQKKSTLLQNHKIILNNAPEKDRIYSIHLAVKEQTIPYPSFIQNIDNPFIRYEDIDKMFKNFGTTGFLIPKINGKNVHPILASTKIIEELKKADNFKGSLRDFLKNYERQFINLQNDMLLHNINTPDDYIEIFVEKLKIN